MLHFPPCACICSDPQTMTMATAPSPQDCERQRTLGPQLAVACEACRKQKMRCTSSERNPHGSRAPCDRCQRNNRPCHIPPRRAPGRRPGALGRYHGVEKAVRQIQTEVRKATRLSKGDPKNPVPSESEILGLLLRGDALSPQQLAAQESSQDLVPSAQTTSSNAVAAGRFERSVCNPLGLLADASGEARAAGETFRPDSSSVFGQDASPGDAMSMTTDSSSLVMARALFERPGYVSLGLKLDRGVLEDALGQLLTRSSVDIRYANYFKAANENRALDTGPDLDPVDLGLISLEEVLYLFPIYFEWQHPIHGILDPALHTPDFVRSRSALLFTWILAITAQFDPASASLMKRLRLHGEKLSKHVHACGYKSVEIAQGYYLSLLAAVPANTLAEDNSWTYTTYALGMISDLGFDGRQGPLASLPSLPVPDPSNGSTIAISSHEARLIRNRERTSLRLLIWEQAHNASRGRVAFFPENELILRIKEWWQHPLADPTDRYTWAFVLLRRHLCMLHHEVKSHFGLPHTGPHWVRDIVDSALDPWAQTWLTNPDANSETAEVMQSAFLRYVYLHGRLWALSAALHSHASSGQETDATAYDCFEAAVNCCEVTVRDLREIGQPMYCMMTPTWAMSSYAAVLALKLFSQLYGDRPGQEVELLALLAEVALQLERAGTVPNHRFGIPALLGQHLFQVLRRRLTTLKTTVPVAQGYGNLPLLGLDGGQEINDKNLHQTEQQQGGNVAEFPDLLLFPGLSPEGAGIVQKAFADLMREWGGPGFEGLL
ncbi:hypothetical protein EDB80DRAFT_737441 [Ilyonectria destructans]|nr:hypothetical protein EDB80DRAFT_737441 [Ilyonectria destructans]